MSHLTIVLDVDEVDPMTTDPHDIADLVLDFRSTFVAGDGFVTHNADVTGLIVSAGVDAVSRTCTRTDGGRCYFVANEGETTCDLHRPRRRQIPSGYGYWALGFAVGSVFANAVWLAVRWL